MSRPEPKPAPRYLTASVVAHPNAELVIGYPAHRLSVFTQLSTGLLFWVAVCGERGISEDPPVSRLKRPHLCPLCFFTVAERAS